MLREFPRIPVSAPVVKARSDLKLIHPNAQNVQDPFTHKTHESVYQCLKIACSIKFPTRRSDHGFHLRQSSVWKMCSPSAGMVPCS